MRPLKDRITHSFRLAPFKKDQIRDYLNSRLRASGYRGMELFAPGAVSALGRYSQGLLRRITILADKAMLAAYVHNEVVVTRRHVKRAAKDSEFTHPERWPKVAAVVAASALAAAGIFVWLSSLGRLAE